MARVTGSLISEVGAVVIDLQASDSSSSRHSCIRYGNEGSSIELLLESAESVHYGRGTHQSFGNEQM